MAKVFRKEGKQLTVRELIKLLEQIPNKDIPVYIEDGDGMCDAYPYLGDEIEHIWVNENLGFTYCSTENNDQPAEHNSKMLHKEYIILD